MSGWDEEKIAAEVDHRGSFLKASDKFFLRGLMPIFLRGDHVIVAGIWLQVDWPTIESASNIWETVEYAGFSCSGLLANELQPWPGTLGSQLQLEVRDQNELPYVVSSDNAEMTEVIEGKWPHEPVLQCFHPSAGMN